jgi:hypothetical protein
MYNAIDTSHPVWAEFSGMVTDDCRPLRNNNWDIYIKYFTRDQLETFTEAFPKIIDYAGYVIDNIIHYAKAEKQLATLDLLIELWGCDYGQTDKFDCISSVLHANIKTNTKIDLLKYFTDHGAIFRQSHIDNTVGFGAPMIKFLLEIGVDSNDVASAFFDYYKRVYPSIFTGLKTFIDSSVDIVGHIEHASNK